MTRRTIGRDTTLCMSLSARPGTFGSRFHNHLYEALELDWIYKAFSTNDLPAAIGGVRALGIRGCAISMPFKEACIPLLDALAPSAEAIASVNTIVNDAGRLTGHNTDYNAIGTLLRERAIDPRTTFALRGSGGMAKAVASALRDAGFRDGVIVARNAEAGAALAAACGFEWRPALDDARPQMLIGSPAPGAPVRAGPVRALRGEHSCPQMLINVTPLGMTGPDAEVLAFSEHAIDAAEIVFDVVAIPVETPLVVRARAAGKKAITGGEVIVLQAVDQFVLYTGITPTAAQIESAAAFARGPSSGP